MQKFIIKISTKNMNALNLPESECFLLSGGMSEKFLAEFSKQAKEQGKLTLSDNKADCVKYNLDGLVLDLSKSENISAEFAEQTKGLKGKIFGVITRPRRHEAMLVSECEPDFVIFRAWNDGIEKIQELVSWYNEFFLIQSALLPMDENLNYKTFKTDFVIIDDKKL